MARLRRADVVDVPRPLVHAPRLRDGTNHQEAVE